jgi:predicted membrane protein
MVVKIVAVEKPFTPLKLPFVYFTTTARLFLIGLRAKGMYFYPKLKTMETKKPNTWNRKSVVTGGAILIIGLIWLLRKAGVAMPYWLFTWEMLLIAIGLQIGLSSKFQNPASYVLMIIGGFFLIDDLFILPVRIMEFFWPALLIIVGVIIISQARRGKNWLKKKGQHHSGLEGSGVSSVSIFNGIKKQITSKNFNGGEIVNVFGGTELNCMQADFQGTTYLDVTVIFGGAKLIIPKNWEVRTEVTPIFGGVDDKRHSAVEIVPDQEKVLIISGTVLFGGLDIVNY